MKLISMLILAGIAMPLQDRKADDLFKDALAKAKETKIRVFLTFGSPG